MERSSDLAWDPEAYARFGDERLRPALELLARVRHPGPRRVHELGCGAGELAGAMAERWPEAEVVGSDASAAMLARAAERPARVRWELADAATWRPARPLDVILANAVLHWVEDHAALFPRLVGFLAPGGVLAVQMPLSWDEPSHRAMREVLDGAGSGGTPLGTSELRRRMARRPVAPAAAYYELLAPLAERVDVWESAYLHVLHGDDPVFEWVRGTGLRPVLHGLDPQARQRFVAAYKQRLRAEYPPGPRGETLYRFPRLFLVATARG